MIGGSIFARASDGSARTHLRKARRVAARLMPQSGDLSEFVQAVARHRGRRIVILAEDLGLDSPTGFWITTLDADYVIHPDDCTADQRAVIICHELAHMLLGHQAPEGNLYVQDLAPSIDPAVAARFLNRHGFGDAMEVDAESMATDLTTELVRRADEYSLARDNISARLR